MTSDELHKGLRTDLGPWFRAEGFRVSRRASLGWFRAPLLVWVQVDAPGWDQYAGGRFFVNFQGGGSERPWDGPVRRLQEFLADDELEAMRARQNAVILKLSPPPQDYVGAVRAVFAGHNPTDADRIVETYLAGFAPVETAFRRHHDVALRYWDDGDVRHWGAFLRGVLPRIVAALTKESAAP